MAATVEKIFSVSLDIADAGGNRDFTVVEGDTGNRLSIFLTDGGLPVDLTGCRVVAVFSKSDGAAAQDSAEADGGVELCGVLNNQVNIDLFPGSAAPGLVDCELQIYSGPDLDTLVTTAKFNFLCRPSMMGAEAVVSRPEYPPLTALARQVERLKEESCAAAAEARDAAAACNAAVAGTISTFKIIRYAEEATQ